MPKLTSAITVKFADSERDELASRAAAAGVPLRTYIRRTMLASGDVSRETALVLAEVRRVRELVTRLSAEGAVIDLSFENVMEISGRVDAIDDSVLFAANAKRSLK